MGGHSYRGGRGRIRNNYPMAWTWQLGLVLSMLGGGALFILSCSIFNLGSIQFLKYPDDVLLGISETRLVDTHSMWVSYIGGGPVSVIDRTPHTNQMDQLETRLVQLMKFSNTPPLSRVENWESRVQSTISSNDYYYWSWYFHKGTTITIEWEFNDENGRKKEIDAYAVKSEKGFDSFDDWVTKTGLISVLKKPRSTILQHATGGKLTFEVSKSDFYFVFFWNGNAENATGYFKYSVSSILYDVRYPEEACYLPCHLAVTSDSDVFILATPSAIEFSAESGHSINTDFEFQPQFEIKWSLVGTIILLPMCIYSIGVMLWFSLKHVYIRQGFEPNAI